MSSSAAQNQLIEPPVSDSSWIRETLGYIEAYDAVLNGDYAFVAFKETERATGKFVVKINSKGTAGGSFDPAAMKLRAREAGAKQQPYFTWGYSFEPSAGDPRQIEFRVHVVDSQPNEGEIFVRVRKADHSAAEPKSVRFAWPQS